MQRRLAAILAVDVVGYSRLMEADEAGTLAALKAHRDATNSSILNHGGRTVKTMGDGLLVEFPSVVEAVRSAIEIQHIMAERNANLSDDRRMLLRIGINLGDVIVEGDDIFGDGVNVAARLESVADPGGICISRTVLDHVKNKVELDFEDLGEQQMKNITEPVHVFRALIAVAADESKTNISALTPPDQPSIAVLPFENLSDDVEQEYFSDGITEDIITTLSKVPRLFVVSRNSTLVYKGRVIDVKEVAAEQGVRYVLEGSIRKAGNRVRITAQLIEASSGGHLWADRYDGNLDDVFGLQDQITQEIVSALEVNLADGEQARVWRKRAGDPRVYEHFMRGRAHYNRFTRRSNAQARQEFEAAIQLNATFPEAYVFLGYTYADDMRWGWGGVPEEALAKAFNLSETAAELDPNLPIAHGARGYCHLLNRVHDAALADAEKAIRLGPSSADTHHVAAMIYNYAGLPEEATSLAKQAVRLSPLANSNYLTELGHSHCLLQQYPDAIAQLKKVLAETPYWRSARALLVWSLCELGRGDEARSEVAELLRGASRFSLDRWAKCHPYRRQENLDHYIQALREAGLPD